MRNLARDTGGATAIEYAMIASLISIVIFAAVGNIGATLKGFFNQVSNNLK